jgi:hypothetical protein
VGEKSLSGNVSEKAIQNQNGRMATLRRRDTWLIRYSYKSRMPQISDRRYIETIDCVTLLEDAIEYRNYSVTVPEVVLRRQDLPGAGILGTRLLLKSHASH